MSLFSAVTKNEYALLLDIGSGSVSLTVVDSHNPNKGNTWSDSEHLLLKKIDSVDRSAKLIQSAVAEVLMRFHAKGVKQLSNANIQAQFSTMQVSIAAPFAHIVSKNIFYNKEKAFTFDAHLLRDLIHEAQEKVIESEADITKEMALTPASRVIMQEYVNGYPVAGPGQQKTQQVELAMATTFVHTHIHQELSELQEKLFPTTELFQYSFILMLYYVLRDMYPEMQEYCLVNQTLEATELAVVREGVLTFTTHDGYGIASLVREIAAVVGNPLEEIFTSIKSDVFAAQYKKLSRKKQKAVDDILENYEQRIVELLQQTGDGFTIPKSIYLHTASCTYDFFATRIERGAEKTTGFGHIVHNLDAHALESDVGHHNKHRSCIELVSRYFFHTCAESIRYKQIETLY